MSLITQCPACATMFKVVPDQLRISDGWVRCGQCDEVFDANAHLHSDAGQPADVDRQAASTPVDERSADWPPTPEASADDGDLASADIALDIEDAVVVDAHAMSGDRLEGDSEVVEDAHEVAFSPSLDPLLDLRPGHAREESIASVAVRSAAEPSAATAEPRFAQMHIKTVELADTPHPSFMRQARGASVWQRTGMRVLLSLVALGLGVGLALQVVLHERDRIAATEPAAKEALLTLCNWLDCTVQPVRQIESVVIDSSSFTKVRTDVYRLNLTLKSTAAIAVAVPALELTLTDMQDQPVVRRVLLASELGAGKGVLDAGAELAAVLPISVKPGGNTERISGYRLLAFYP